MQLLEMHAEVEHQQAAQLRVAVLLDDEIHFVLVEELPDLVAERIRAAAKSVRPDRLCILPDCGCLHLPQPVAFAKLKAMVQGAQIVRKEIQG